MTKSSTEPQTVKIAINGFGRIGRAVLRAYFENDWAAKGLELVVINETAEVSNSDIARLSQYDSVHGRFAHQITADEQGIRIAERHIQRLQQAAADQLPWAALGVDIVLDCSGQNRREQGEAHLAAGAQRVLFSAPVKAADFTMVVGFNHTELPASARIVSNASCTTNCLALVLAPLQQAYGIQQGLITTVHAWTADQKLLDGWHAEPRRERAAPQAIVPTSSGAAYGVMNVMPELSGKLVAHSLRVPVMNMSLAEVTLTLNQTITTEQLQHTLAEAAAQQPNLLGFSEEPLVSCDYIHDARSAIVDKEMTHTHGDLCRILAWHDNEWAYACRMLDGASVMVAQ